MPQYYFSIYPQLSFFTMCSGTITVKQKAQDVHNDIIILCNICCARSQGTRGCERLMPVPGLDVETLGGCSNSPVV